MSYGRMKEVEPVLAKTVEDWISRADGADDDDDRTHGPDRRGDETPDWMASKQSRLEKIRAAKAALEAEAEAAGQAAPDDKAQRNFTDPESRIQKTKDGFIQGYNAQAAVDHANQIIVACDVGPSSADNPQLVPMVDRIIANTGAVPNEFSADAGYSGEANLAALEVLGIDAYVAAGRQRHGKPAPSAAQPDGRQTARRRLGQPLPSAQGHGRTGLRPDQAGARLPTVPDARPRQRPGRMGDGVHRPQPLQARRSPIGPIVLVRSGTRAVFRPSHRAARQTKSRPNDTPGRSMSRSSVKPVANSETGS